MSAGPARLYSREAPADGARQPGTLREPAAGSSISALPTRPGGGGYTREILGVPSPPFPAGARPPALCVQPGRHRPAASAQLSGLKFGTPASRGMGGSPPHLFLLADVALGDLSRSLV